MSTGAGLGTILLSGLVMGLFGAVVSVIAEMFKPNESEESEEEDTEQ